jgi:hypothetical protein
MRDGEELAKGQGAQLERARELLSAVAPLSHSRARMTRIWRALEHARPAPPRAHRRLTLALSLGLVFLLTALAAAQGVVAVRAIWASVGLGEARVVPGALKARDRSRAPARVKASAPASAPKPEAPVTESPSSAREAPASVHESNSEIGKTPARAQERSGATGERKAQRASEAELVRQAVRALRRDGDPALAARLLEQAHTTYPRSALAEETMSLRVEAALARGDAHAESYARQYLTRYPAGRYRALVAKALHD